MQTGENIVALAGKVHNIYRRINVERHLFLAIWKRDINRPCYPTEKEGASVII
jgi:hypothetical protein